MGIFKRWGRKILPAVGAVSLMVGGVVIATEGAAVASVPSRQIQVDTVYGYSVEVCGLNQNNDNVCGKWNTPYLDNVLANWWWKVGSGITVTWWSGYNGTGVSGGDCFIVPAGSGNFVITYWLSGDAPRQQGAHALSVTSR
jgi:hypothetical protein